MDVLILGGTTEASVLATRLGTAGRWRPVLSLAGRTRAPVLPAVASRRGGFGGAEGLAEYLRAASIAALVDATHPFAARMQWNAAAACTVAGVPRVKLLRPGWMERPDDRWTRVDTMPAACSALGPAPRRVFLTVGQQELEPFLTAPWHEYLVRSVEPPSTLPPRARSIAARGPFTLEDELALLRRHAIEVLVTKDSGGTATAAKLAACRVLEIPVVMVSRPPSVPGPTVPDVAGALAFLDALG